MSAKGKISRIPATIRKQLNERIRDGVADVDILPWLNALPDVKRVLADSDFGGKEHNPEISAQNLSEYRREGGPYLQWLRDEIEVDGAERRAELAMRLAEKTGGMVSKPLLAIWAGRIGKALDDVASEDQGALLKALTGMAIAEAGIYRAQTDRDRLAVQTQTASLEKDKFRYQVAKDALTLFEDKQARSIAEGKGSREEKIQQLLAFMEKAEKEE
jgi:hypothetical protein